MKTHQRKLGQVGFECAHENIVSLYGCPKIVKGDLDLVTNNIKVLTGISSKIYGHLWLSHNPIESLKDIHKQIKYIKGKIFLRGCPIKSHVLGLLSVDGLQGVNILNTDTSDLGRAMSIINKYLQKPFSTDRIYDCQDELIEADLEDYAQM